MPQRRELIHNQGICTLTELDQLFSRAIEAVTEGMELEPLEDALDLIYVIGIFRTDEKVKVHITRFGEHIQTKLDVGEDELNPRQTAGFFVLENLLVGVRDILVSHSDRFDCRL